MFIGEMGCWLVVGAFSAYRHYVGRQGPSQVNGYQALRTTERQYTSTESDADSIQSNEPLTLGVKAPGKTEDDRLPLKGLKVMLLSLPALCDICGTTLMNLGFLFVVASIYQMTRGALVIFVGLFSVMFLKKRLQLYQWSALVMVVLGVGIVGLAGALYKEIPAAVLPVQEKLGSSIISATSPDVMQTVVGILLIAGAQIFTATQFVLEEFILEKYALEPLKVVGWEGIFGFLVTTFGMILLHLAIGRTDTGRYGYFDMVEGWRQITTYKSIGVSSILIMISIGFVSSREQIFAAANKIPVDSISLAFP
jgi:drug/metabolite transporter (DMT)-like permease